MHALVIWRWPGDADQVSKPWFLCHESWCTLSTHTKQTDYNFPVGLWQVMTLDLNPETCFILFCSSTKCSGHVEVLSVCLSLPFQVGVCLARQCQGPSGPPQLCPQRPPLCIGSAAADHRKAQSHHLRPATFLSCCLIHSPQAWTICFLPLSSTSPGNSFCNLGRSSFILGCHVQLFYFSKGICL